MSISADIRTIDTAVGPGHSIRCAYYEHERRPVETWDVHAGLEIGVVLEGQMIRHWPGLTRRLGAGQLWLCDAMEAHGFSVPRGQAKVVVAVVWPGAVAISSLAGPFDFLGLFKIPPDRRPRVASPSARHLVLSAGREFVKTLRHETFREQELLLRVQLLLLEVSRHSDQPATAHRDRRPEGLERILPALKLLEDGREKLVTVDHAAQACHVSRSLFTHLFRAAMGTGFADYARRRRLAQVAVELRSGRTKLSALAPRYGYVDAAHLSRTFRRYFHMTPRDYRDRAGSENRAAAIDTHRQRR